MERTIGKKGVVRSDERVAIGLVKLLEKDTEGKFVELLRSRHIVEERGDRWMMMCGSSSEGGRLPEG